MQGLGRRSRHFFHILQDDTRISIDEGHTHRIVGGVRIRVFALQTAPNSNDVGAGGAPSALATAAVGSADAVVAEKLSRLAAVLDELAAVDVSLVSDAALVEATAEAERLALRTAGAVTDRLIVEASDRDLPRALGFRDVRNFMGQGLHIGDPAARHRVIGGVRWSV